ncbi:alpha/beta hydrolase [Rhodococcus sp. NPDC003322]
MAATLTQLRRWQPGALAVAGGRIERVNREFDDTVASLRRRVDAATTHWSGSAATAATAHVLAAREVGDHTGTAVRAVADALTDAAGALGPAAATALAIADDAAIAGFAVADDGRVTAPAFASGVPVLDLLFLAQLREQAGVLESRLVPALDAAGEADLRAAAALATALAALDPAPGAAPGTRIAAILDGRAALPDQPRALRDLWATLTPAEKDALFALDPAIGNRDGLPAVDKHHYNSIHLDDLREGARARLDDLDRRHPDWARGEDVPPDEGVVDEPTQLRRREYEDWCESRDGVADEVAGYDAVARQIEAGGGTLYLLGIDDEGRAAIAVNNPDTAVNVATFVPGTGSTLSGIGGDVERSQSMLDAANLADPAATAVITWHGYNAPQSIVRDAALRSFADAGAPRLDAFQDGLRAAHDGPPAHAVVIGHSYGTTVIGTAAAYGSSLGVDELVFVGSPGVTVPDVDHLRLDGVDPAGNHARVYVTAAKGDPVPLIGDMFGNAAHGPNPARDAFGAQVFEGDPGTPWHLPILGDIGIDPGSHSDYWDSGNPSLEAMGRIIVGQEP